MILFPPWTVAILLAIIWGAIGLLWHGVGSYWERRHMTEARKKEVDTEKKNTTHRTLRRYLRIIVNHAVLIGLPLALILDGFGIGIGLLYSPQLSALGSYSLLLQTVGLILSGIGLVIMYGVGKILAKQIYGRAVEERKMMTTGIYAYVRHPFYVHFLILPVGMGLLTLNYLMILFLLVYAQPWAFLREIAKEERELVERYGKDYEDYMKRTGRFLPKIRK